MEVSETRIDPDISTWMCHVIASDLTAQILETATTRRDRARGEQIGAERITVVSITDTKDSVQQARRRWLPATVRDWWKTASREEALDAYIAALEFSAIDDEARAAAELMRTWFTPSPHEAFSREAN